MKTRVCERCLKCKPIKQFATWAYHGQWCKPCWKIYHDAWVKANIEKDRAYKKKWKKLHPEQVREEERTRRNNNIEKFRAAQRKYYAKNPERSIAHARKWQLEHPERHRENGRRWSKSSKGRAAKRRNSSKRRSRQRVQVNDLTAVQWEEIINLFENKCAYCKEEFVEDESYEHPKYKTQDHLIPLSLGGNHTKSNIVPAGRSCNSKWHTEVEKKLVLLVKNWPNLRTAQIYNNLFSKE